MYGKDDMIPARWMKTHLWEASRYTELDPVRAQLVAEGAIVADGNVPVLNVQRLLSQYYRQILPKHMHHNYETRRDFEVQCYSLSTEGAQACGEWLFLRLGLPDDSVDSLRTEVFDSWSREGEGEVRVEDGIRTFIAPGNTDL